MLDQTEVRHGSGAHGLHNAHVLVIVLELLLRPVLVTNALEQTKLFSY